MSYVLRPYQEAAKAAAWDYLAAKPGNPVLVLPTGAGKSPLMAALATEAVQRWGGRVGVIAHVKELIEQTADKLRRYAPDADVGIYAAGLRRRDRFNPIVVMQIQSVAKRAYQLGRFDLLLIDEAHRVPLKAEGMYRQFIADCRKFNPHLRVIGLTATPYRLQGRAVPVCGPENVLTEIAYEANIPDLIRDGYLSRLTSKAGARPDLSGVHLRGGEYVEAELAGAMLPLVERTVGDFLARAECRRAGIVFCVNVEHAEAVMASLQARGETCALVTGETPAGVRAEAIAGFTAGRIRWMVNVNVLSEGFDAPHIDCVVMLRPTKSPGLFYQQAGRGFRIAEGKDDCLILDYAGNTLEHGPIDEIRVRPSWRGKAGEVKTGPAKECPHCNAVLPIAARQCPECGHQFGSTDPVHADRAIDAPVLSTERERVVNRLVVKGVKYERHEKPGKPPSMRVIYQCGLRRVSEWVCLEHSGFARSKAVKWWMDRADGREVPRTVEEALPLAWQLRVPVAITVDETDKYPSVLGYELGERVEVDAAPVDETAPVWLRAAMERKAA